MAPAVAQEDEPQGVRVLAASASGELCSDANLIDSLPSPSYVRVRTTEQPVSVARPLRCTLTVDLELAPGEHADDVRVRWAGKVTSFATSASQLVVTTTRRVDDRAALGAYQIVNDDFEASHVDFSITERTHLWPSGCVAQPTRVRVTAELLAELSGPETPEQTFALVSGRLELPSGPLRPCHPDPSNPTVSP